MCLHGFSKFVGKEDDIDQGFGNVRVQVTEVVCKFVNVLSQQLIGVLDAVVDVGDLVKSDSIQVLVMCKLFCSMGYRGRMSLVSTVSVASTRTCHDRIVSKVVVTLVRRSRKESARALMVNLSELLTTLMGHYA